MASPSGGPAQVFRGSLLVATGSSGRRCRELTESGALLSESGVDRLFRCALLTRARMARSAGLRGEQDLGQAVVSHCWGPPWTGVLLCPCPRRTDGVFLCACSQVPTLALPCGRESTFLAAG